MSAGPVIRHSGDKLQGHPAKLDSLPAEWTAPGFDDKSWQRAPGPFFMGKYNAGFSGWGAGKPDLALIALRGKFMVSDPTTVQALQLDLGFRGGAVVYLNGQEVARAHLPEGAVAAATLAEAYPKEAFVGPDGKPIRHAFGDPERMGDRLALRRRKITAVSIDPEKLLKGVNVLAIELHRAPYDEAATEKNDRGHLAPSGGKFHYPWENLWSTVGFTSLTLKAAGAGIQPNCGRPAGVHIWNQPICQKLQANDYNDPTEPLLPLFFASARNGVAQGLVAVGSDAGIKGLKVTPGELRLTGGNARLPVSCMEVSYFLARGGNETLTPTIPADIAPLKNGGTVVGVWLTLHVPRATKPGAYVGVLSVAAEGAPPMEIPITARVHDWVMPDAKEFRSHVGLVQSPDSVAMHYKTPMWSDRHWTLMEKSFQLLGEVGNDYIWVPVMRHSHFGNKHGMVRFVKRPAGPDMLTTNGDVRITAETHAPDFGIAERYVDLAIKHQGKPDVVCVYGWEAFTEKDGFEGHPNKGIPVTILDPATGKEEEAWAPKWGTPEAVAFWKPVFDGVREILKKHGVEKTMMFGTKTDAGPRVPQPMQTVAAAAPEVKWITRGHPAYSGPNIGYCCHVWGAPHIPDPSRERRYGWKNPELIGAFPRAGNNTVAPLRNGTALAAYYVSLEGYHAAGHRGFGSMGADFWEVLGKDSKQRNPYSKAANLIGSYYESHYGQVYMGNSSPAILAPGPDGAWPTLRLEMVRAAAQLAEARVYLEEVLTDAKRKALLGDDLAARTQALLDERTRAMIGACYQSGFAWFVGSGWQERDDRLYALCAEVAGKLAAKSM
jgi:hypothetical protein